MKKSDVEILKWVHYWVSCYECPCDVQCNDDTLCNNCLNQERAIELLGKLTSSKLKRA